MNFLVFSLLTLTCVYGALVTQPLNAELKSINYQGFSRDYPELSDHNSIRRARFMVPVTCFLWLKLLFPVWCAELDHKYGTTTPLVPTSTELTSTTTTSNSETTTTAGTTLKTTTTGTSTAPTTSVVSTTT